MKLLGITQRVAVLTEHEEIRDTLDQRWSSLIFSCGYLPYPIPNQHHLIDTLLKIPFAGIILSGGGMIGQESRERDLIEIALLEHALSHSLPLLGVCRGMELIMTYFGAFLEPVKGHAGTMHRVNFAECSISVNSYHNYGTSQFDGPFQIIARSEDGIIEAIEHRSLPIRGIMWHPERTLPFTALDKDILCHLFK
jgi:N5-(cytidine 5'-diphosphoramidyl)-L-glutamine hydrolase